MRKRTFDKPSFVGLTLRSKQSCMAENYPELVIRVFLMSKLIPLTLAPGASAGVHANPSPRSWQVYANLETFRED